MNLAERLQELRKEAGYSQEELAEMLGVSRQALSKWETALTNPDINNVVKLSKIYNRTTDYILLGKECEPKIIVQEKVVYQEKKGFQKLHDLPKSFRIAMAVTIIAFAISAMPFVTVLLLDLAQVIAS